MCLALAVAAAGTLAAVPAAEAASCGTTQIHYITGKSYTAKVTKTGSVKCKAAKTALRYFGSKQKDPPGWDCHGKSGSDGKITLTCKKGGSTARAKFGPL